MKKTKLPGLDEIFDDAQGLIDEIYEIQDPIEDKRWEFLDSCEFEKVVCGNVHHATVGLLFAMAASTKGANTADMFKSTTESPYIAFNKKSATGKLSK